MQNKSNLLALVFLSLAPGLIFQLSVASIDQNFWLVFPIIVLVCSVNLGFLFIALFTFSTDSRLREIDLSITTEQLANITQRAIWANLGAAAASIVALCLFFMVPLDLRSWVVSAWLSLSIFGFTATGEVVFAFLALARALALPRKAASGFSVEGKRA